MRDGAGRSLTVAVLCWLGALHWGWLGFGLLRAGGDEGVQALDRFLVADAEAGFVAGHAVDLRARVAPGDAQEHVGDVALFAGAVVGGVEFVQEVASGVREGVLLEGELAVEVEESGFGTDEVLETDFAEGDFATVASSSGDWGR